jgi:soluble lytic murein transglycosylase
MAVITSESSFNPECRGGAGEIGLMQILPSTGKWMSKRAKVAWKGKKTLLDPVQNVRLGSAYLAWLRGRFDSHARLYLAAYNMGQKNVDRALSKRIWPKTYPTHVMGNYVKYYNELRLTAPSEKDLDRALATAGDEIEATALPEPSAEVARD